MRPSETIQHALARVVRAELARATAATDNDDRRPLGTRVHEIRSSLKRARAALKLARPGLGPHARREILNLAAMARRLGELRDSQIVVETFDGLAPARRGSSRALSALRAHLRDAVLLVKPDTVIRWHRTAWRLL
jgi:CHAD domain-containing protein